MTPIVIHHANCPDGVAAAWVARRALGDCEIVAATHNEPPPDCAGRDVYIVDFSYKREVTRDLINTARSVTVLDHHQTAVTEFDDWMARNGGPIFGVLDINRSGCVITWKHFFPAENVPLLLLHIEDRDLWKFTLPGTAEVMAAVTSQPLTVEAFGDLARIDVAGLFREGKAINRFRDQLVDQAVKNAARMTVLGHSVMAANCPYTIGSDVAGALAEANPEDPFAAYWYRAGDLINWGLRSRGGGGADVAAIAETAGGGGHKHASGFKTPAWPHHHGDE